MTARASARCCGGTRLPTQRSTKEDQGGIILDARRMTYGIGARHDFTAHKNSSRKKFPQNVFGGAALACIVLGSIWTLTANVLGTGADPAAVSANVVTVGSAITFSARF